MPCLYRDQYQDFVEIAKSYGAKPENQTAREVLNSIEYYEAMLNFDERLEKVSAQIWEEYIKQDEANHK
jgi:hypothetical protein